MSEDSFLSLTVMDWGRQHHMKESTVKALMFLAKGTHLCHLYSECQMFGEKPAEQQLLWVQEVVLNTEPPRSEEIALVRRCLCVLMQSLDLKDMAVALEKVEVAVGVLSRDFIEWATEYDSMFPKCLLKTIRSHCTCTFGVKDLIVVDFAYICYIAANELLAHVDKEVMQGEVSENDGENAKNWIKIGYNAYEAHMLYRAELVRWYLVDFSSKQETKTWAQTRGIKYVVIDTWFFRGCPTVGSLARFIFAHLPETSDFIEEVKASLGEEEGQKLGKCIDSLITLSEKSRHLQEQAAQYWSYFIPNQEQDQSMVIDSTTYDSQAASAPQDQMVDDDYVILPDDKMDVDQEVTEEFYDPAPPIPVPPMALAEELLSLLSSQGLGADHVVHDLLLNTMQIASIDQLRAINKEQLEQSMSEVGLKIVPKKKLVKVWESLHTAPTTTVTTTAMAGDVSPICSSNSTAMIVDIATIRSYSEQQAIEDEILEDDIDPEQCASFAVLKQQRELENSYLAHINDDLTDHASKFSTRALEILKLSKGEHQQRSRRLGTYMVAARDRAAALVSPSASAAALPAEGEAKVFVIKRLERMRALKFKPKMQILGQCDPSSSDRAHTYGPKVIMLAPRVQPLRADSLLINEKFPFVAAPSRATSSWADDVKQASSPHFVSVPVPLAPASSATWTCNLCKQGKLADHLTQCTSCFTPRPPQPWLCSRCDKNNTPNWTRCASCYLHKGKPFVQPSITSTNNNGGSNQSKGGYNSGTHSNINQNNGNGIGKHVNNNAKKEPEKLPGRGPGHAAPLAMVTKDNNSSSNNSRTTPSHVKAKPMMTAITSQDMMSKKYEEFDGTGPAGISARLQRQMKEGINALPPPPSDGIKAALTAPPSFDSSDLAPAPNHDDNDNQVEPERQQNQGYDQDETGHDGAQLMALSATEYDNEDEMNGSLLDSVVSAGASIGKSLYTSVTSFFSAPEDRSSTDDNDEDGDDDGVEDQSLPRTESMDRDGVVVTVIGGGSGKKKRKKRKKKNNKKK